MNVLVWCRYVRVFVFVCLFRCFVVVVVLFFQITREALISKFVFIPQEPVFPTEVTPGKDTPTQGDRDERCMARFFLVRLSVGRSIVCVHRLV